MAVRYGYTLQGLKTMHFEHQANSASKVTHPNQNYPLLHAFVSTYSY